MKGFRLDRAVPQHDVNRLMESSVRIGCAATDKEAYDLWLNYSIHSSYGWLSLPDDDDELDQQLRIAQRLKTTDWYL